MSSERAGTTTSEHENPIAKFFKDIFGNDNTESDERPAYDEAFRRGSCGLTVSVDNDQELDRAAEILNSAGAVDIDERSQQWRNEGWTGGATSMSSAEASSSSDGGLPLFEVNCSRARVIDRSQRRNERGAQS